MTVILTLVGCVVFVVSLFTAGFKQAWRRLAALAITGFVIDVLLGTLIAVLAYVQLTY